MIAEPRFRGTRITLPFEFIRVAAAVVIASVITILALARQPAPAAARAGLSIVERVILGAACVSALATLAFIVGLAVIIW